MTAFERLCRDILDDTYPRKLRKLAKAALILEKTLHRLEELEVHFETKGGTLHGPAIKPAKKALEEAEKIVNGR